VAFHASAKLDLAEDGLGKNPSARPDIGKCTFSCKTRHEKPQEKWNFVEHLKTYKVNSQQHFVPQMNESVLKWHQGKCNV
jgi:hypothetical protein